MKSREIGPFSLACTDPYIGIGWEYQSIAWVERHGTICCRFSRELLMKF